MNKLFLLVPLLILLSCRDNSVYQNDKENHTAVIIPKETMIEEVSVVDWKVGSGFKYTVSKGIRLKVTLPLFPTNDLIDIVRNKEADAWLFRISKRTQIKNDILGHVYIPLLVPGKKNNKLRIRQLKNATFDIYYAAASVSKRFQSFQCPAFGHSKEISKYNLNASMEAVSELKLGKRQDDLVEANVYDFGLSPTVFNGGEDLIGTYVIDMAFYNVEKKARKSNFVQLRQTVEVKEEKLAKVRGCENFQIPEKDPSEDKVKQFKFGQ